VTPSHALHPSPTPSPWPVHPHSYAPPPLVRLTRTAVLSPLGIIPLAATRLYQSSIFIKKNREREKWENRRKRDGRKNRVYFNRNACCMHATT
jgi:hypothetical protein